MTKRETVIKIAKLVFEICGGWWGIMSGALSIPLIFLAVFVFEGQHPKRDFAILAFCALGVLVFRIGWKNYQLIEGLKTNAMSGLEIEGIQIDMVDVPSGKYICQIRVHNHNPQISADSVRVELLELDFALETKDYYKPSIPRILLPENKSINPGTSEPFTLFNALKVEGRSYGVPYTKIYGGLRDGQLSKDTPVFAANKNYRLKIRATARHFAKAETEFVLNFMCEGTQCRFTLTAATPLTEKEKKEIRRAAVVERLGQFRMEFIDRAKEIRRMSPAEYKAEKINNLDQKTVALLIAIDDYFTSNPIELGTNAVADMASTENMNRNPIHTKLWETFGESIDHPEWEGQQHCLIQNEKNLAKIIDKLNAKPL